MKKINEKYFITPPEDINNQTLDSALQGDEKILWRAKPKRKSFILNSILKGASIGLIFLIFDVCFITLMVLGFQFGEVELPIGMIIFLVIFFLMHLTPFWMWIYGIISASRKQKLEEYAFTNKRIIVKKGFVGSTIISIYYDSLVSVNLKVGIVEKMCYVGDIYLVSKNEKVVLEDIENPLFISQKLQSIANDIKTDIIYPNNLRPSENNGYKTEYKSDDINNK